MSIYDEIPDELIEYIVVRVNGYFVKKDSVDGRITFGRFDSIKEACAAACMLCRRNWRLMNVINDPLINYGNEFWVFKVEENKLILDNKFDDYESAVEFIEINSKCNDYHNDIFRDSLNKKHSDTDDGNSKEDVVGDEKFIFKKFDKFLVKRSSRVNAICVGEFDSIDVAFAARKIALDSKWNISNEHEIAFYNDYYWVFDVSEGILTFKGKSQSYDDALDIIEPIIAKTEINPFLKAIDENYDEFMAKKKTTESKNIKFNVDISKIWDPILPMKYGNQKLKINIFRSGDKRNLLFKLEFDISNNNVLLCKVNDEIIEWNKRYQYDLFSEFQLILNILELNQFDLSKIEYSSTIHYYDGSYYKILLFDKNNLVFDKFTSYNIAEKTSLECGRISLKNLNFKYSLDIDKVRGKYELVKFHKGNVFKLNPLKSLEKIKVIRDILLMSDWDFEIFDRYDLFYLNGLYWEISMSNNIIYLFDKYDSIQLKK